MAKENHLTTLHLNNHLKLQYIVHLKSKNNSKLEFLFLAISCKMHNKAKLFFVLYSA